MRFKYETFTQYFNRVSQWHKWFAWHPVDDDNGTVFWLETIERKRTNVHEHYYWEYREVQS